jgi:nitrogen fixation/metabolism regulation signal transduction histidine kinase
VYYVETVLSNMDASIISGDKADCVYHLSIFHGAEQAFAQPMVVVVLPTKFL